MVKFRYRILAVCMEVSYSIRTEVVSVEAQDVARTDEKCSALETNSNDVTDVIHNIRSITRTDARQTAGFWGGLVLFCTGRNKVLTIRVSQTRTLRSNIWSTTCIGMHPRTIDNYRKTGYATTGKSDAITGKPDTHNYSKIAHKLVISFAASLLDY